jgi:hypothetical protein
MTKPFPYIYEMAPIDFWDNCLTPSMEEEERVLKQMPEKPRIPTVYKLLYFFAGECELFPIFLCKADNNGTVYVFSDRSLYSALNDMRRTK